MSVYVSFAIAKDIVFANDTANESHLFFRLYLVFAVLVPIHSTLNLVAFFI